MNHFKDADYYPFWRRLRDTVTLPFLFLGALFFSLIWLHFLHCRSVLPVALLVQRYVFSDVYSCPLGQWVFFVLACLPLCTESN